MTKVRVYELAKEYGMKGPELADLLRELGFDQIKSHMAVLDGPDQMMVVARLEAQGLTRSAEGDGTATSAEPKKKSLPKRKALPGTKKSLPPPVAKEPPRKKLQTSEEPPALPPEPEPAAATAEPAPATDTGTKPAAPEPPAPEPAAQPAASAAETPEPAPATPEVAEPAAPAASAGVEAPAAAAREAAAPEPPALEAGTMEAGATAAELETPPAAEPTTSAPAAAAPPPAETAEAPAQEAAAGADNPQVKRLLVPQKKAQVVGRIELPQETIRDATRRSAPISERDQAARRLRRQALQSTQSRTAAPRGGVRRGPGGPGRGRTRDGSRGRKQKSNVIQPAIDPNKVVEIEPPISVKNLSEALGIKVPQLLATLAFKLDIQGKTINSFLSPDEVELVALELERKIKIVEQREAEEELIQTIVDEAKEEDEYERAPVLTFMGHVDHGKTTLLDALRSSDVTKGEAGGITQHIGAYKIRHSSGARFVVLDTPGHAAFTSMRARGASLTDIVVLVVAADDGVMPQTEEAISHALAAKVPIVVAVNKCDRPGANPMQVRQQLSVKGLQPEEWGGNVQMVDVSATTGQGLDDLIEKIQLESELLELRARPSAAGVAVVVESKQTPEQGVVVNVLVTNGTLRVKDRVLCGESLSRVRSMTDDHGEQVNEAGPSTPVMIMGIDELPQPGDHLYVINDVKKAKEVAEDRQRRARDMSLAERSTVTLENLSAHLAAAAAEEIKVILKADVMGSLEPIKRVLAELNTDEVRINIIHAALGGISETDVSLAEASGALIVGFNSVADSGARQAADRAGVQIKFYDVIYNLIDDMKAAMEGMLAPEEVEKIMGHTEVRALFKSSKVGTIAGCYVLDGTIARNHKARLSRDGKVVYRGPITGLRRHKDEAKEVRAGFECGVTFDGFNDIKVGDQIETYVIEFVKRTLE